MKKKMIRFICGIFILLLINTIFAADVAYILKKERNAEQGFLDVLNDLGLSVEFIESKEIKNTDFSTYKYLIIGDNRLRNIDKIPKNIPIIIASHYYLKEFGLLDKGRAAKKASNVKLKAKKNREVIDVYDRPSFKRGGVGIPYYYLPDKYKNEDMVSVAMTYIGKKNKKTGDVISYSSSEGIKKCFFGITKSKYWTPETRNLFKNCVEYVTEGIHDVKIDETLSNSINGIRIKDIEAGEYILDDIAQLECNKDYKVDYKTLNVGDYTEDIDFTGVLGNFSWTTHRSGLDAGLSTTAGSKTFIVGEDITKTGLLDLEITANIFYDDNPQDNYKSRRVEIVGC